MRSYLIPGLAGFDTPLVRPPESPELPQHLAWFREGTFSTYQGVIGDAYRPLTTLEMFLRVSYNRENVPRGLRLHLPLLCFNTQRGGIEQYALTAGEDLSVHRLPVTSNGIPMCVSTRSRLINWARTQNVTLPEQVFDYYSGAAFRAEPFASTRDLLSR